MRIPRMLVAVGLVVAAVPAPAPANAGAQAQTSPGDRYQGHDGPNIDGYRRDIGGDGPRHHARCHADRRRHRTRACR